MRDINVASSTFSLSVFSVIIPTEDFFTADRFVVVNET